ncbi:MAG: hypothetical protein KQI62_10180 [Deltaproteobacteria bacterium]|nr:hypothetical protein [Deltaproteobacteria bacterium]
MIRFGGYKNLRKRLLFAPLAALMAVFLSAGWGWAQSSDDPTSVEAIQKRLEELRVIYKPNHPEVVRYERALEKAKENEARRQTEELRKQMQQQRPQTPTKTNGK